MKIVENNPYRNIDVYTRNIDEKTKVGTLNKSETKDTDKTKDILKIDKVELSAVAKKFQEAKKIIDSLSDTREQKIAALKNQIKSGTYHFDREKVAAGMLRESLFNDLL